MISAFVVAVIASSSSSGSSRSSRRGGVLVTMMEEWRQNKGVLMFVCCCCRCCWRQRSVRKMCLEKVPGSLRFYDNVVKNEWIINKEVSLVVYVIRFGSSLCLLVSSLEDLWQQNVVDCNICVNLVFLVLRSGNLFLYCSRSHSRNERFLCVFVKGGSTIQVPLMQRHRPTLGQDQTATVPR